MISEIGHLSVRTRDLDAVEEVATEVMGLRVTEKSSDELWLTCDHHHHNLHYMKAETDAVRHVGLVAPDGDAVQQVRERVKTAGWDILRDRPEGPGIGDGFAFTGPEGAVFEIYSQMDRVERDVTACRGVPPIRFGHVNFLVAEPGSMQRMLTEVLDFRVSDYAGEGQFLRCNVDHHGIGVFPGPGHLHHCAWEVSSAIELGQLCDLIDQRGGAVLWGPMRHGIGGNIATYFVDPSGLVIEYYAGMERIYDDEHHQPTEWDIEDQRNKWLSLWGPQFVPEEFMEMGLPFNSNG